MTNTIHFNVNNIDNISVYPLKCLKYKWYEYSRKPRKWLWGLFTAGTEEFKPGWCDMGGFARYYNEYYGGYDNDRRSAVSLERSDYLWIGDNDRNGAWYEKAKVIVNKTKGDQQVAYFKIDKEAIEWVNALKEKSGDDFEIIIYD